MTRRAHPYPRTRSAAALVAAASSCLAAVAFGAATLAPVAEGASGGGAAGLGAPAGTSTSSAVVPSATAAVTIATSATTPNATGGAAMSAPTAAPTPTSTSTTTAATTTTGVTATTGATATTPTGAASGGIGLSSGGAGLSSSAIALAADQVLSVSGDGFTLQVHASGLTAQKLTFTGTTPSADAGQELVLQRAPAGITGTTAWTNAAHGTIATGGSFKIGWTSKQSGRFQVRAVLAGAVVATTATPAPVSATPVAPTSTTGEAAAVTAGDSPAVNVTIFKAADATFYGPGLWGRHTACGEVLRKTTLGVANRTLKCGTEVNVYFNGNEITVPVIDRGPYVTGVDWDLTKAAANAVGLTDEIGRGTIGTLTADPLAMGTL